MSKDSIVSLYTEHARLYDRERGRSLQERAWLDRFLSYVRPGGTILDIGCGMGEPIARYLIERGFTVVGIDAAPSMIELCRVRFPDSEWIVANMTELALAREFDGVIAWDSFFHLGKLEQRAMFARFAAHARIDAPLMFTSGSADGEAIGTFGGQPLYHASLDQSEYEQLLANNGFVVREHMVNDPDCGNHTVWLATRGANGAVTA